MPDGRAAALEHVFQHVQKLGGREWAKCSCGWASPDLHGLETCIAYWTRHVKGERNV